MVWTRENDGSWVDHFAAWFDRVHGDLADSGLAWSVVEDLYEAEFDVHARVANMCGYPLVDVGEDGDPGLQGLLSSYVDYVCVEPVGAAELTAAQAAGEIWEASLPKAAMPELRPLSRAEIEALLRQRDGRHA